MNKKKWQAAILIAAILAIAFFWNGDFGKSTVSVDDSSVQSHAGDGTASSQIAEEQPEQAYDEDGDVSVPSESADKPVVNTDAAKRAEALEQSADPSETAGATGSDGAPGTTAGNNRRSDRYRRSEGINGRGDRYRRSNGNISRCDGFRWSEGNIRRSSRRKWISRITRFNSSG